jgi:protein-S-isoprenylcysteine O-methyltransferase Ste14
MFAVALSTLVSFVLVLLIVVAQPLSFTDILLAIMLIIGDPPVSVWLPGFGLLFLGIVLHGWSRWVRQSMASSWEMRQDQVLVKNGPYSRVRHPSYTSYILSFLGLLLMIPSVTTALLLVGIPGYYTVAMVEERHLVQHFGKAYEEYMGETGRFFPVLRRRQAA